MSGWVVELGDATVQEIYERVYGDRLVIPDLELNSLTSGMIDKITIDPIESVDKAELTILEDISKKTASELGNLVKTLRLDKFLPLKALGENINKAFNSDQLSIGIPEEVKEEIQNAVQQFDQLNDPRTMTMDHLNSFWTTLVDTIDESLYQPFCGYTGLAYGDGSLSSCDDNCASSEEDCESCKLDYNRKCCVFLLQQTCSNACQEGGDEETCSEKCDSSSQPKDDVLANTCWTSAAETMEDYCCVHGWVEPRNGASVEITGETVNIQKDDEASVFVEQYYEPEYNELKNEMGDRIDVLMDVFDSLKQDIEGITDLVERAIRQILGSMGEVLGDVLGDIWDIGGDIDFTILFKCIFFVYNNLLSAGVYMCAYLSISAHLMMIGQWVLILMLIIRHRGMRDPEEEEEYSGSPSDSDKEEGSSSEFSSSSSSSD